MWYKQCFGSGMIYSGSSSEFSEFRIQAKVPDPTHVIEVYLENETTLNSFIKKNLSTICHILFHTTVLQYPHKVQNSKRNNIFIYLLIHILLDPEHKFWIQAKVPDPQYWFKFYVFFVS